MLPFVALADDLTYEKEKYLRVSWDMFTASRICLEDYNGLSESFEKFEMCFKAQHTCKTIYDGVSSDERRKWLIESDEVKRYITGRMLEPLDYCHILKLMSLEQKKIEGQTPKEAEKAKTE
jgi:hypothetical protein